MELRINGRTCRSVADVRKVASAAFCNFLESWFDNKDHVIGHTSGSTGKPKEIHLKKSDMVYSARMTNGFFGLDSRSRFLLCLSPDYIAGKMMIVRAIEAGSRRTVRLTVMMDYRSISLPLCLRKRNIW